MAEEGDSIRYRFRAPVGLARFVASKGSVALNGVSLTVNEVRDEDDSERDGDTDERESGTNSDEGRSEEKDRD